jgi:hypothetical protein
MDRADLLGSDAGYEPGGGYRSEGLTWRGLAIALVFIVPIFAVQWFLDHRFGSRIAEDWSRMLFCLVLAWMGVHTFRFPSRYRDDDSPRRRLATRVAAFVLVAITAGLAAFSLFDLFIFAAE